jgi:hypothetical protein
MERYFTQDGVWRRNEGEIVGLPALKAFLAGRTRSALTRHVLSNVRVTLQGSEHAIVHSYVTAYRHQFAEAETLPAPLDQALLVGRYQDTLVLVKREWKIALRELQVDFRRR